MTEEEFKKLVETVIDKDDASYSGIFFFFDKNHNLLINKKNFTNQQAIDLLYNTFKIIEEELSKDFLKEFIYQYGYENAKSIH